MWCPSNLVLVLSRMTQHVQFSFHSIRKTNIWQCSYVFLYAVLCIVVCLLPWVESVNPILIRRCSWTAKSCHKRSWSCCFSWKWVVVSRLWLWFIWIAHVLLNMFILMGTLCFRYGESFPVSAEVLDSSFCLPIGKAKVTFKHYLQEYCSFFSLLFYYVPLIL